MKRPDKIVLWRFAEKTKDGIWIDHTGKQLYKYTITIPFWAAKAMERSGMLRARVELREKNPTLGEQLEEERQSRPYFEKYWLSKITKMRKLNKNYMLVSLERRSPAGFKSLEDYNKYHAELCKLDKKYIQRDDQDA